MNKTLFLASTALFGASALMPALAQTAGDTIVVTATKREQTLQEVPIAVTVIQEETIENAQIIDAIDLQSIIPSLTVNQLERTTNVNFSIRGFGSGANNPGIEPSTAVFIDGVFRSRAGSALDDLLDLERVEVLKGPQSTLFGKNASAGVVSIVTKKPEFEWGGQVEATLGNYDSRIVRGVVTGPINDTFAFSLAGSYNQRDGYFDNQGFTEDYNNKDRYSLRGQVLAQPTDDLEFRLIADYSEITERCCGSNLAVDGPTGAIVRDVLGGETAPPNEFGYTMAHDFENNNEVSNQGISLQMDWDINDDNTLTWIGAGRRYDDFVDYEGDFTTLSLLGENIRQIDSDVLTQEVRLVGSKDRFSYILGGFYFYEDTDVGDSRLYGSDAYNYVNILVGGGISDLEAALGLPVGQTFWQEGGGTSFNVTQKDTQFQVFTQMDFEVTERLTLTGGIAYFQADKEIDFTDVTRTNPFSDLNFVDIGFASLFTGVTTLPATPDNIAAFGGSSAQNAAILAALQQAAITTDQQALANGGVQVGSLVVDPATGLPLSNGFLAFFPDLQPLGPLTPFPNSVEDGKSSDNDTPYTLRASYDLTARTNIYLSYATGFKASSWNLTPDTRPSQSDFNALVASGELAADSATPGVSSVVNTAVALELATGQPFYSSQRFALPEETEVLEFGLKTRFPWGQLNMAVFDQTVINAQESVFIGTGFVVANVGERSTQGLEIDTIISPPMIPGLTLNIATLWIDARNEDARNVAVQTGSAEDLADGALNGRGDISGGEVPGVPEFSGSFGFEYRQDFRDMGEWFIRSDYQYESETQVVSNIAAEELSRSISRANASVGLQLDNGLEGLLWVRNLNEADFFTSGFPTTLQAGSVSAYPVAPRTWGVTLRKRF